MEESQLNQPQFNQQEKTRTQEMAEALQLTRVRIREQLSRTSNERYRLLLNTELQQIDSELAELKGAPELAAANPQESTTEMPPAGAIRELWNYQNLVNRVVDAFGDEIKASRWLSLPNSELNGETPLQTAQRSGYDTQALEPILTRIEHGIYS